MRDPIPAGAWSRSATAIVLLAVGTPPLIFWLIEPAQHTGHQMVTVVQGQLAVVAAMAAAATYFHYRIVRLPALGWASLILTVYALECLTLAMIRVTDGAGYDRPGWVLTLSLTAAVAGAAVAHVGLTRDCPGDPLALGLVTGLAVALLHLYLDAAGPVIAEAVPVVLFGAVAVALWAYVAVQLTRPQHGLPRWWSTRFAVGTVLLALARILPFQPLGTATLTVCVLVASLLGGVLILGSSIAGLREAIHRDDERREQLAERLARLEADHTHHRSRMHEITNTIAGIACASHLINDETDLPDHYRGRLEEMLDRESARLVRILGTCDPDPVPGEVPGQVSGQVSGQVPGADQGTVRADGEAPVGAGPDTDEHAGDDARPVDLDDLIRPLVSAQMAIGREVLWIPRGLAAVGDADALTEAINILLDNARKHAPRASTTVITRPLSRGVEILVLDNGPGMPEELRDRWEVRGARGAASQGQGLGLGLARARVAAAGGSLELTPSRTGTVFAVRLPSAPSASSAPSAPSAQGAATAEAAVSDPPEPPEPAAVPRETHLLESVR